MKASARAATLVALTAVAVPSPGQDLAQMLDFLNRINKPIELTPEQVEEGRQRFCHPPEQLGSEWLTREPVPEEQRAAPLLDKMAAYEWLGQLPDQERWWDFDPQDTEWSEIQPWLDANAAYFQLLDEATARPHLGAPVELHPDFQDLCPDSPPLFAWSLQYLSQIKTAARAQRLRALRDIEDGSLDAALKDIERLEHLSDLASDQQPTFLVQMLAWAIDGYVYDVIQYALRTKPAELTEPLLARTAKIVARTGARDRYNITMNRLITEDVINRVFDEDQASIGATWFLMSNTAPNHVGNREAPSVPRSLWITMTTGSAKRAHDLNGWVWDLAQEEIDRAPWLREEPSATDQIETRLKARYDFFAPGAGDALLVSFFAAPPELDRLLPYQAARDARHRSLLLALTLHRHHLRHGAWPPTLADLDPDLLPADITDAHTGEPLHYKLTDAGPVVYSAGPDRDDDDARPLLDDEGEPDTTPPFLTIDEWQRRLADDPASIDGDWVLYPPQE